MKMLFVDWCASACRSLGQRASQSLGRRMTQLLCVLFFITACAPVLFAAGENLHAVRTVFVDSFGADAYAAAVRRRVVDRFEKSGLSVVGKKEEFDAILHGKAVILATGTISNSLRSNSARQEMYQGYLSVELTNSSNQTLWSYMATPGRFRAGNIVDDLADQVVTRLEREVKSGVSAAPPAALGYVPLPREVVSEEVKAVDALK